MARFPLVSISTTSILHAAEESAVARLYSSPGRSSAMISTRVAVSHASESNCTVRAAVLGFRLRASAQQPLHVGLAGGHLADHVLEALGLRRIQIQRALGIGEH